MIETERLILRPWSVDDTSALYNCASDPRVSELAMWPTHTSATMSREVIEKVFMPNPHCFAIVLKETDLPIGCIGLVPSGFENHDVEASEREVGYWIGHRYWNAGLTTEALRALTTYCRDNLNLSSLLITTDDRNTASGRVAEKCDFQLTDIYFLEGVKSRAYRLMLQKR